MKETTAHSATKVRAHPRRKTRVLLYVGVICRTGKSDDGGRGSHIDICSGLENGKIKNKNIYIYIHRVGGSVHCSHHCTAAKHRQ